MKWSPEKGSVYVSPNKFDMRLHNAIAQSREGTEAVVTVAFNMSNTLVKYYSTCPFSRICAGDASMTNHISKVISRL